MIYIKIHSTTAKIVAFPTIDSYYDWVGLLRGNRSPKTTWDLYPYKPRVLASGLTNFILPYYTMDEIVIGSLNQTFAVRLYKNPQVHPETGKTFIGWAVYHTYYTLVN